MHVRRCRLNALSNFSRSFFCYFHSFAHTLNFEDFFFLICRTIAENEKFYNELETMLISTHKMACSTLNFRVIFFAAVAQLPYTIYCNFSYMKFNPNGNFILYYNEIVWKFFSLFYFENVVLR